MKRLLVLFFAILLLLVGCTDKSGIASSEVATTPSMTPPAPPEQPQPTGEVYRILFSSDVHCTDLRTYSNVENDTRLQHWVDSILAEHAREPIDLLVINGDTSLDHVEGGGAILSGRAVTTQTLIDDYISQLPAEISIFIMPGNHEQHSHANWYSITGNKRQGYRVLGDNLFVFLDTYNADLNPKTNHNGVYSGVDQSYIKALMESYPTHNVYLISHYFDITTEGAPFQELLFQNRRIIGLFHGHTHRASVNHLGLIYGNKTIAQTGNFSYPNPEEATAFWGFRELVITEDSAYSRYIVVPSSQLVGSALYLRRRTMYPILYYGTMPED